MNTTPRKCLGFRTPLEAFAAAAAGSGPPLRRTSPGIRPRIREQGAGKPPARICEGEAEWPSYSTG